MPAGWLQVQSESDRVLHWAHTVCGKTRFPCGIKVPKGRVGQVVRVWSDDPSWRAQSELPRGSALCSRCLSELVRARHALPFDVGDAVVSRVERMVLYGRIEAFFEDRGGQVLLNLTRFWPRPALDDQENPREWYRAASECQRYVPGQSRPKRPPKPHHTLLFGEPTS
ncbi:hypothetical protein [Deinococcus xianganensis]|uniref:Uncharacterized protein n=1 Tax=Deinococcus xianganensis TaxID=1507289 RepID=A0A6I4YQ70_9DEIO|nr:hypothetical protein [Deinococcus xianganensis]MXV22044.1 hypothetical protein [Deinococcus xianganensis]